MSNHNEKLPPLAADTIEGGPSRVALALAMAMETMMESVATDEKVKEVSGKALDQAIRERDQNFDHVQKLNAELVEVRGSLEKARESHDVMETHIQQAQSERDHAKKRLEETLFERGSLERIVETTSKQLSDLHATYEKVRAERDDIFGKLLTANSSLDELRGEFEHLKDQAAPDAALRAPDAWSRIEIAGHEEHTLLAMPVVLNREGPMGAAWKWAVVSQSGDTILKAGDYTGCQDGEEPLEAARQWLIGQQEKLPNTNDDVADAVAAANKVILELNDEIGITVDRKSLQDIVADGGDDPSPFRITKKTVSGRNGKATLFLKVVQGDHEALQRF